ncbi:SDR family NAD(P)-dependent oxidoreductase [Pseudodonghicola flavimaris]|uniref:SDR family NAD(P)-dependent oxidoreductase n=1 Tax=Pseudodonghicola flavimaris TaxID=3050036 RepID=A0ABT7F1C9_9RHOB|nr:SDR family NAD(P)-dependent oxidoreductase [Pseudodonghicola flavimaris]MDK3018394.1 SDR family NAD(P)-dependent oxidoreductase [Pseudodonghicola flavimaris]
MPEDRQEFAGRVVFVTGGASGIGAETARLLAGRGARVMIADLDGGAAEALAADLRGAGGQAAALWLDVSDAAGVTAAIAATLERFGRLDGCVNNAGVVTPYCALADIPLDEWARQLSVNLTGVFHCLRAEIPALLAAGGGSIVNMSSILGVVAAEGRAGYAAAKHGVVGLTRSAALDYATQGIRVNAIAPGYVDTPILSGRDDAERRAIADRHPMQRLARPAEIAEAICFLLSDRASFMTGAVLGADGGYTAR